MENTKEVERHWRLAYKYRCPFFTILLHGDFGVDRCTLKGFCDEDCEYMKKYDKAKNNNKEQEEE